MTFKQLQAKAQQVGYSNLTPQEQVALNSQDIRGVQAPIPEVSGAIQTPAGFTGQVTDQGNIYNTGSWNTLGRSNLSSGETVQNPNGSTTTGGTLFDSTDMTQQGYLDANKGAKVSDYNDFKANENMNYGNTLGTINTITGVGGLLGNLYFGNENLKLQKEDRDRANTREAKSDAKKAKFQANVLGSY